jgi:hypothetical protein
MIQICSWPNKKRKVKRGMQEIWNDLTAYSSNEKSYYQIEKFMFENYQKKTNQEFVKDFLLNVLLNPFFLLER